MACVGFKWNDSGCAQISILSFGKASECFATTSHVLVYVMDYALSSVLRLQKTTPGVGIWR